MHTLRLQLGLKLHSASSLTLFYFSCTLWLSSPWARRTSLISTDDKWRQFVNRCSAANKLCLWLSLSHAIREASLTASIRPLSVGDFSISASNTSSISFLTYSSTAERGGGMNLQLLAAVSVYIIRTPVFEANIQSSTDREMSMLDSGLTQAVSLIEECGFALQPCLP